MSLFALFRIALRLLARSLSLSLVSWREIEREKGGNERGRELEKNDDDDDDDES